MELDDLYDKITARRSHLIGHDTTPDSTFAGIPYRKLEMEANMMERHVRQFMNLAAQVPPMRDEVGNDQLNVELRAHVEEVQTKWKNMNQQLESCHRDELDAVRLQQVTTTVSDSLRL